MITFLLIILGITILVVSADVFVDQASALAKRFKVSDYLIGFTVVAFGTSLPELVSTIFSALSGHNHLVISNIIGSNLVNTALIIGLIALFQTLRINQRDVVVNLPLNLAALAGFWALAVFFGFSLNWLAGISLLVMFFGLISLSRNQNNLKSIKKNYVKFNYLILVLSLSFLIISGKFCIDQVVSLANQLKISETLLGYFLLAIGTSLPELITTWIAVKKRNGELGIGNILGSNLFNLLFILGISTFIQPLQINGFKTELVLLTGASLLAYYFAISGKKYSFNKWEGLGLVSFYLLFIAFQALNL